MKKLTTSVLAVVLTSSFMVVNAQNTQGDTLRTQDIREVVVTGALGIKKRQDAVVTSNKVIDTKELNQAVNPNAAQALTGKVPGLLINTTSNSVNSQATVTIRGPRSISGNNQALVVIDGAISTLGIFQQLPPEIVESVNVIKGQQGSALYGEKGSNGVIVVTTKRGTKSEKIQFTLTSSVDVSSIYKTPIRQQIYGQGWTGEPTAFSSTEYGGTNWVPYENGSWGPAYSDPQIGGQNLIAGLPQPDGRVIYTTFSPKKDNMDKFFKNGVLMQNGVSMNVGGKDSYSFLSFNRVENDFMIEGDQLKRNTFFYKGGKQLGKFRIDATFNLIDQNTSQTGGNLYAQLLQTPTNINVRDYASGSMSGHWTGFSYSPYWLRDHLRNDSNTTTFNGIVSMGYEFNKNISLTYTGNMTTLSSVTEAHTDGYTSVDDVPYSGTGTPYDGTAFLDYGSTPVTSSYNKSLTKSWRYYGDLMLNFNYDLTDNLNFKLNVGNNIQDTKEEYSQVGGTNLQIPGWYNIQNVLNPTPFYSLNNNKYRKRNVAWFGNLDLGYKDYLFLNATYRYEQSSVLSIHETPLPGEAQRPLKNQGYSYYSAGVSFIPTKAFVNLTNGNILSYAKVSGGFTRTGNSILDAYSVDEVGVFPTGYPFGSLSSYILNRNPVSQDIKPEFNNTLEANLSLGFVKDRITFDGSVYQTKTDGLITNSGVSNTTGISAVFDNAGSMRNRGFELELGLTPFKSKNFEWNLKGSYATYKSLVTSLDNGAVTVPRATSGYGIPAGLYAVLGGSANTIMGTAYQRDTQGRIIVDAAGLPVVSSQYQVLGKLDPDYTLTFSTSIRFKSFTLSAVADYRTGNSFVSEAKNLMSYVGTLEKEADFDRSKGYVIPNSVQNTGTASNPVYVVNTTPVGNNASYAGTVNYFTTNYGSDIAEEFVIDGTALKVREIALNYSIPKTVLSNTFVNSMSIGVYARNPFVIYAKDNRNFGDAEMQSFNAGSLAVSQYPTARNFGFNVNITF
ncbi:SusC/RagA family TonB-linked outer membrane protein [Chryseobacterium hagamense]|uniref:SusC/RagA family TonB-linked outer membrane protein n=1 Tax=Chryseobacterium hagamense TaxID=395935 RepID=A0A511YLC7_9FLAO|nr:SusC/RagA family TonB-linked outer membrane protein [Chryseobacterium hagamense]GEN75997.1 SusC/RagA family TonB-linked outer membrane protein [Chryseobacterium hagamense]